MANSQHEYNQFIWLTLGASDLFVPSISREGMGKTVIDELNYLPLANLSSNKAQSKAFTLFHPLFPSKCQV